jgi:hypothetical protein
MHFGSGKKTNESIKSDNLMTRNLTSAEIESERIKKIIDEDVADDIFSTRALNNGSNKTPKF